MWKKCKNENNFICTFLPYSKGEKILENKGEPYKIKAPWCVKQWDKCEELEAHEDKWLHRGKSLWGKETVQEGQMMSIHLVCVNEGGQDCRIKTVEISLGNVPLNHSLLFLWRHWLMCTEGFSHLSLVWIWRKNFSICYSNWGKSNNVLKCHN
jgi:hypothetical protein